VHAEASTFGEGLSKKEVFEQVLEQASALFDGQRNWVSVDWGFMLQQKIY
jgi:L-methionine (R)-S-oxide reductase